MQTIGLIGGTSWVSTVEYYRLINQMVNDRLGGLHSAKILLYSVNHEEFKADSATDWEDVGQKLSAIAYTLQGAGADCILICANTMHMVADAICNAIRIPLIHIAEETAKSIKRQSLTKIGLLGTRTTMEHPFFKERLFREGIETMIPDEKDREYIQSSIFLELGKAIFSRETKERYIDIINKLIDRGAEGIILGCTEIPLLIKQEDCLVPTFDTMTIHAQAAVEFILTHFKREKKVRSPG
jgi:aspartate racemase